MRDYPNILVGFIGEDKYKEGYAFEKWPHHITVLPWFKADTVAIQSLETITKQHLPVQARIDEIAMFGVQSDILVRIVESESLRELHSLFIKEHDGLFAFANSRFVGDNYHPHVTLSGDGDPEPGMLNIGRLSLVKATGHKHVKQIRKQF